jgi:hypothetical protein
MVIIYTVGMIYTVCMVYTVYTVYIVYMVYIVCITKYAIYYKLITKCVVCRSLLVNAANLL